MDISELSKKTGIAASKIRYYEEKGLIKSIGRNGLKRVFASDVVTNLSFIALAQSSGFTLDEIFSMLSDEKKFKLNKASLTMKIDEIALKIKALKKMSGALVHMSNCREKNHFECPNFQRLLKKAIQSKNFISK